LLFSIFINYFFKKEPVLKDIPGASEQFFNHTILLQEL